MRRRLGGRWSKSHLCRPHTTVIDSLRITATNSAPYALRFYGLWRAWRSGRIARMPTGHFRPSVSSHLSCVRDATRPDQYVMACEPAAKLSSRLTPSAVSMYMHVHSICPTLPWICCDLDSPDTEQPEHATAPIHSKHANPLRSYSRNWHLEPSCCKRRGGFAQAQVHKHCAAQYG